MPSERSGAAPGRIAMTGVLRHRLTHHLLGRLFPSERKERRTGPLQEADLLGGCSITRLHASRLSRTCPKNFHSALSREVIRTVGDQAGQWARDPVETGHRAGPAMISAVALDRDWLPVNHIRGVGPAPPIVRAVASDRKGHQSCRQQHRHSV
jgi:hypothetical protein